MTVLGKKQGRALNEGGAEVEPDVDDRRDDDEHLPPWAGLVREIAERALKEQDDEEGCKHRE